MALSHIAIAGPILPPASVSQESEVEPWYNFPTLPAARVEDPTYVTTYGAWQIDWIDDDSPIEEILAGLIPTAGPYELPNGSINPFELTADQVSPDSMTPYEAAWIEYLRLNQERFGLLPSASAFDQPGAAAQPAHDSSMAHSVTEFPPVTNDAAAAVDAIPEISSSAATLIGGSLLALSRWLRRRSRT